MLTRWLPPAVALGLAGCTPELRRLGRTLGWIALGIVVVLTVLGALSWRSAWRQRPTVAPGRELACARDALGGFMVGSGPGYALVRFGDAHGWAPAVFSIMLVGLSLASVVFALWALVAWVRRVAS